MPFELSPVVTKQCSPKQPLEISADDLGYNLRLKLGRQFAGSLCGFQAFGKRTEKGGHIGLNEFS